MSADSFLLCRPLVPTDGRFPVDTELKRASPFMRGDPLGACRG